AGGYPVRARFAARGREPSPRRAPLAASPSATAFSVARSSGRTGLSPLSESHGGIHTGVVIAFATLWLGLVTGSVPVELLVGADVARVEVRLDGEICSTLSEPPWAASCELGGELAPHELVALAFDAKEAQVGEARQWLNLPREPAELEVAVTREAGPPPRLSARLAWAGPGGATPTAV